jgi:probable HAF family extracellular repeat protein
MRSRCFQAIIALIGVFCANAACAVSYELRELPTLGGSSGCAMAINSDGLIVGYSGTGTGTTRACVWRNGIAQDLGSLGGNSLALAVNAKGDVVGFFMVGSPRAFLWSNGTMVDLGTLAKQETIANDINDSGQIVGYSVVWRTPHLVLWQNGAMEDMGTLGGVAMGDSINNAGDIAGEYVTTSDRYLRAFVLRGDVLTDLGSLPNGIGDCYVNDINDSCWIVGQASDAYGHARPFLWRDGAMEDMGMFGVASAVSNTGSVVGWYNVGGTQTHAFVWEDGVMQDLGALQTDSRAYGINENGWIVGESDQRAVVWVPVPEPSSVLALAAGLASLGGFALRRRRM